MTTETLAAALRMASRQARERCGDIRTMPRDGAVPGEPKRALTGCLAQTVAV
ncbi:hypothetical protein [Actinoplanes sp. G11-F43]|uniref:hypothetical protein n=1 Tax=Actinoplanes sp. G11-F43 TaxID=3424130 RepID=UPI003D33CDF9